ncbi:MAG: hypothetical protein U0694_06700 [Anaerolineae bacterium]
MVNILHVEEHEEERLAARQWWSVGVTYAERFFKSLSQFDVHQVSPEYVINLQMCYIQFERLPFPAVVKRARETMLNSMYAFIMAAHAALSGDEDKARQAINKAFAGLLQVKKELSPLGIELK